MVEIAAGEIVDTYINLPSPTRRTDMDPNIVRSFAKSSPDVLGGVSPAHMVERMDAAGVERGLLNTGVGGVYKNPYLGGWRDGFTLEHPGARARDVVGRLPDPPLRALRRGGLELPLREGVLRRYMRENALEVFN